MNWMFPLIGGFVITFLFTPILIKYFRAKKEGQMIRDEGPSWHESKSGTPTMGGLTFIVAIILTCLAYGLLVNQLKSTLIILLFVLLFYGLIGMWDDSIKLFKRQNEGFKAWQKFALQVFGALVFAWVYEAHGFPMAICFFNFGDVHLGIFYVLFIVFWLTGFSNAVNLTDGLDGLVSGLSIIAFAAYAVVAFYQHQYEIQIFCMAVVGALLAFLCFNHKPAKIFMGDMGSLALGGSLAAVSILLHHEFSLLWIGLIFVIETLSVMLQVGSFKLTGKRIFKMTPIHHSFEMSGWSEWKIDIVFWTVGLITAITGVMVMI
ncbi:phospho-N-acetylmuramoyl-pentapeptide-transferase [Fructilactobacillus lindneri]|nr:phospho-N-acetylmuramoyl-pentapeptide-transferase [Fructilactobacillus lindneri]ANZ58006.1 phospho-N-acetylmuramoyl-pentapeptide-transferase [Fructilactobacillus lindneri]ANZ59276.1 phospho-N-acetylmuramoyl-pentapeptide-transferase [Fructilactobacillus lindneri]POG98887.1 phospho-N-acetylmuramoyl-pentapeptide-transferase [Fructilactobacillus lindneri]POH00144.1 phospho-N-acetylmuramoyl-pentapeptide-transferase [Fructilactobacillus lindneri]POH04275.1 phospho-N-acetylmuramoyl-pentapeptide-tr